MTPEVIEALQELERTFPNNPIKVEPDDQGGASVVFEDVWIGEQYQPPSSWIGFHIDFQYSRSDVYPHYIDNGVRRVDGCDHGQGFSGPMTWQNRQAIQISRRSNRWNPAVDTAAAKLIKVLDWLRTR